MPAQPPEMMERRGKFVPVPVPRVVFLTAALGWACVPPVGSELDAAAEGEASASSVFSATGDYTPDKAVDGRNDTAWLSATQSQWWAVQELRVDLRGAYHVRAVEIVWASTGVELADLAPKNFTVSISINGLTENTMQLVRTAAGSSTVAVLGLPSPHAWQNLSARYVSLRLWNFQSNNFYGVTSLRVLGIDSPLTVGTSAIGSWLIAGTQADITWGALPGVQTVTLEMLNSPHDRTPYLIQQTADQEAGSFTWSIPPLSGEVGHGQPTLATSDGLSSNLAVGSNLFLRVSRPQGNKGRRTEALLGPLALAGNMAKGGQAGATSWDSLVNSPPLAFDGKAETSWSNDCEMGIGGSSGGEVGEVVQIFLPEPAWVHSLVLYWPGPKFPSTYTVWGLPFDSAQRSGPGWAGLPDPMADLSMNAGYMAGWEKVAEFNAVAVGDPFKGRTDRIVLTGWPLKVDVLRLQVPFDWLASCYPLAEWEVVGVPLLTVANPIDGAVVAAGKHYRPAWTTPPGSSALANIVESGAVTLKFGTLVNALHAGWIPSNVSGWGSCFGQPFSNPSGIVVANTAISTGGFNWSVPCTPGAAKYYLTLEFVVNQNPVKTYSEFFAISREPQRPQYVGLSIKSARAATIVWQPGYDNGAAIQGYTIELRQWHTSSKSEQHTRGNFTYTGWTATVLQKNDVFPVFELSDLVPFTNYSVRLGGVNLVGPGAWSELLHFQTQPDTPAVSRGLDTVLIRSNDVNMTWVTPYHNGDLIDRFVLNLHQADDSRILQSHEVSIVKCRDPNLGNATVVRVCPLDGQKGFQDCSGVLAPESGSMGNCAQDGWLYHGETCNLQCNAGFQISGLQPTCAYGKLTSTATCIPAVNVVVEVVEVVYYCNYTADDTNTANINEEACYAIDEKACADINLTAPACAATGVCTFVPDLDNTPQDEESCVPTDVAACEGVVLDGNNETCLSAGECVYTWFVPKVNATCEVTNSSAPGAASVDCVTGVNFTLGDTPEAAAQCTAAGGGGANCTYFPETPAVPEACGSNSVEICAAVVLGINSTGCEVAGLCTHLPDNVNTPDVNEETCVASMKSYCSGAQLNGDPQVCRSIQPAAAVDVYASADPQLRGDRAACPGRTTHQNPPGLCPFRICRPGEIRDCNGICLSDDSCNQPSWGITVCDQWGTVNSQGDGFCANGQEESSAGYKPNFNCPYHNCEGGDCGLDPFGNGVACGKNFNETLLFDPDADLTASCDETPEEVINITLLGSIIDAKYTYNTTVTNGGACVNAGKCAYTPEIEGTVTMEENCVAMGAGLCPDVSQMNVSGDVTTSSICTSQQSPTGVSGICIFSPDNPSTDANEEECAVVDVVACDSVMLGIPNNTHILGQPVINSTGAFFNGDGDAVTVTQAQWGSSGSTTISIWLNKFSEFTPNDFEYVFSQNPIASRTTNIQLIIELQQYLKVTMVGDNSERISFRTETGVVLFDRWQHIAITSGKRGTKLYLGGLQVPASRLSIFSGSMASVIGAMTMNTDLFLGCRSDQHPSRMYRGAIRDLLLYSAALSAPQIECLYESQWGIMVAESCYDEVSEINAADAGVIGVDGSQSFCGPSAEGNVLWHIFEGLVSGVDYTINVIAVNSVGGSELAPLHFAARTALMQVIPNLIERSVTKPHSLDVESMLVNLGDGRLHWNISKIDFAGNVTVTPMGATVEPDGVGVVGVSIASLGLAPGTHRVLVTLSSNAATRPGIDSVEIMMSVDSNGVAEFSTAEGDSLASVTRGGTNYKITIRAYDADNQVAVAGNDPFVFRIDKMPSSAVRRRHLTETGNSSAAASGQPSDSVASSFDTTDWTTWFPTTTPVRTGTIIGFGSGMYRAEYDAPQSPGYFLTSITLNGKHIKGSPFLTQSVCGVGEYDDEGLMAANQQRQQTGDSSADSSSAGNDGECMPCDAEMTVCDRKGLLLSDIPHVSGVWRSSRKSPHFHWCDNAECLAGVGPTCDEGYSGIICRSCSPGYGQIVSSCLSCPAKWLAVPISLAISLNPLWTVNWWMRDHLISRERYRSQLGAIDKIAINFLWTAGVIPSYQAAFPPLMETLFGTERALTAFGSGSKLMFSCVTELPPATVFLFHTMIAFGIPLGMAIFKGFAMIWFRHIQRFDLYNDAMLHTGMHLYIAFPAMLRLTVQAFNCVNVDPESVQVLMAEPAVTCDSIGLPAWFVLAVGGLAGIAIPAIPILSLLPVWRARRSNTLSEETMIWRFGYLYAEYEYTMWELGVLLRKGVLTLIPVLLTGSAPQSKYLLATCLFFFAILMQALMLPYTAPYAVTAQCELVSMLCNFAIFACCFFREGLAVTAEGVTSPEYAAANGAKTSDGVSVAIALITVFALSFFYFLRRLVGILENDTERSGAITWSEIQVYFCYSLIPRRGSKLIRSIQYEKRMTPLHKNRSRGFVSGGSAKVSIKSSDDGGDASTGGTTRGGKKKNRA